MKIDKLYTLSQFILMIRTKIGQGLNYFEAVHLIFRYHDFLLQPLKKEMFVNEIEKPIKNMGFWQSNEQYEEKFQAWQEAEKKVIFEESKRGWCEDNLDVYEIGDLELCYNYHTKEWHLGDEEFLIKNLSDLAEKTNGELKTKNLEI